MNGVSGFGEGLVGWDGSREGGWRGRRRWRRGGAGAGGGGGGGLEGAGRRRRDEAEGSESDLGYKSREEEFVYLLP